MYKKAFLALVTVMTMNLQSQAAEDLQTTWRLTCYDDTTSCSGDAEISRTGSGAVGCTTFGFNPTSCSFNGGGEFLVQFYTDTGCGSTSGPNHGPDNVGCLQADEQISAYKITVDD